MTANSARLCPAPIVVLSPDLSASQPVQKIQYLPHWACVAVLATLQACHTVPSMPPAPPTPNVNAGMSTHRLPPYRLQVGDVIDLRLLLNPELNEEVTVRPDGHISTTVVNDELAGGRTVPELTAALRSRYARELHDPKLSVIVKSFAPTRIYVAGEVTNPGEFVTVGPNLTLSQAIARAGGVKMMTGDEVKVFIIRRGPSDVPEMLSARYNNVMWGKDAQDDVRLAPYDVVFVPRSSIAEVYRFVNSYLLQFMPVNWGFNYSVNPGSGTVLPAPTGR
jgi:polysaccharide export outer membrane protein